LFAQANLGPLPYDVPKGASWTRISDSSRMLWRQTARWRSSGDTKARATRGCCCSQKQLRRNAAMPLADAYRIFELKFVNPAAQTRMFAVD
jgi:hypothetical protein